MKTLVLIRHAKSSWEDAAITDFNRHLNTRGLKDAGEMAARLLARISHIDAFISSAAVRAVTTAEKFMAAYGVPAVQLVVEKDLYLAPTGVFNRLVAATADNLHTIAVFAHNPGITDFTNTLTTSIKTDNIPTCGIFAVSATVDHWKDFAGAHKTFLFYDYPKLAG